ncbi:Zinc finger SWIM domain-containing protein 7 [Fukomys damarensis]|uniref:Zinc finger SWIM domain-containing protein 7 n=1 Tax=Fukomys damarensis TaxID=885580 RepID=A0A091E255_FUKDA|nr:Zinc finger SWIM domain-containing protein 7 [Fukomys damarensis]
MAVALPAVVEELLSEVAAAVRECARSTGLSRAWLRCGPRAGRGVEAGRAGGASKPGALSSAPRPDHCALGSALLLRKSDSLLCKHLLAVYLSQVMRTCQQLSVSDKQLTDILMEKK